MSVLSPLLVELPFDAVQSDPPVGWPRLLLAKALSAGRTAQVIVCFSGQDEPTSVHAVWLERACRSLAPASRLPGIELLPAVEAHQMETVPVAVMDTSALAARMTVESLSLAEDLVRRRSEAVAAGKGLL